MTATDELIQHWREIGPVSWCESSHGWIGVDGMPITLAAWQRAALNAWDARRGAVSTLAVSNIKKTGKTFVNAALLCWRWLALPGQHFAAANDLDQSAGRQFQEIVDMIGRHNYLRKNTRVTKNVITFEPTGSTLTALAVDAAGNAGSNHLTVSHTEAWGIVYEAGIRAWEELTPPPGRFYGLPCLRVVDSYAGHLGESETWHSIVDRGLAGERVDADWPIYLAGGLLLFHSEGEEAQRLCFRGTPDEAAAYYTEQRQSLRVGTYERLHLNRRTAAESAFIPAEDWQACFDANITRWHEGDRRRMVLAVDASTSNDTSAITGTWYNPDAQRVEVIYTRLYKPSILKSAFGLIRSGKATIDLTEIEDEVLRLHQAGAVDCVTVDPFQLHHAVVEWQRAGVRVNEMNQGGARIEADQGLWQAIKNRTIAHDGDQDLAQHIGNAATVESLRGFRLVKSSASRKIDLCVSLSMSHHACLEYQRRTGEVTIFSPNPFYSPYESDDLTYTRVGDRYVGIPRENKNAAHELTAEAVQKCRRRMSGCPVCIQYFEQCGEYERQNADAAAHAQEGRPLPAHDRLYIEPEPDDHFQAFAQKFHLPH